MHPGILSEARDKSKNSGHLSALLAPPQHTEFALRQKLDRGPEDSMTPQGMPFLDLLACNHHSNSYLSRPICPGVLAHDLDLLLTLTCSPQAGLANLQGQMTSYHNDFRGIDNMDCCFAIANI